MQPIDKQDVLIRLLKDGHISDEEFKALWESIPKPIIREAKEAYGKGLITSGYIQTGNIKPLDEHEFTLTCNSVPCEGENVNISSADYSHDTLIFPKPLSIDEIGKVSKGYHDSINAMMERRKGFFKNEGEDTGV